MTTKNSIPSSPSIPSQSDLSVPSDKSDQSVSTLESLVPPLDLCKQIPEGQFSRSVFVWSYSCDKRKTEPFLDERDCIEFCRRDMVNAPPVYPAPTLQEILVTMKHLSISLGFSIYPLDWRWYIYVNDQKSNDGTRIKEDHDNPTTAALKLWLELNKEGNEK